MTQTGTVLAATLSYRAPYSTWQSSSTAWPSREEPAQISKGPMNHDQAFFANCDDTNRNKSGPGANSSLIEDQDLKSFLAKLGQDSNEWIRTVSSIDVASMPETKVAARRQQTCLNILNELED